MPMIFMRGQDRGTEGPMFSECETTSASLTEEFTRALRLLHSSDAGSAEELRDLLFASIAKRYGSARTSLESLPTVANPRYEIPAKEEADRGHLPEPLGNDGGDKDEVPRISIPDEGYNDEGPVCKVCNVSEFGPLILVQCQECRELYHPLCHQPPIIDVDVHNSDFLWRCTECEKKTSSQCDSTRDEFFNNSTWIRCDGIKPLSKKLDKQL